MKSVAAPKVCVQVLERVVSLCLGYISRSYGLDTKRPPQAHMLRAWLFDGGSLGRRLQKHRFTHKLLAERDVGVWGLTRGIKACL